MFARKAFRHYYTTSLQHFQELAFLYINQRNFFYLPTPFHSAKMMPPCFSLVPNPFLHSHASESVSSILLKFFCFHFPVSFLHEKSGMFFFKHPAFCSHFILKKFFNFFLKKSCSLYFPFQTLLKFLFFGSNLLNMLYGQIDSQTFKTPENRIKTTI